MLVSTASFLAAAAALVAGNSVTFQSLDDTKRTVYFTPNEGFGLPAMDPVTVAGHATEKVMFMHAWVGNWYAVEDGAANEPGMLGEVAFDGWNGIHYFDVSAIVNPNDKNGVKQMWPAHTKSPVSGCTAFPCNNAYYLPDDMQTKATTEPDLVCTLGVGSDDNASADDNYSDTGTGHNGTTAAGPETTSTRRLRRVMPRASPSFPHGFVLGR